MSDATVYRTNVGDVLLDPSRGERLIEKVTRAEDKELHVDGRYYRPISCERCALHNGHDTRRLGHLPPHR